MLKNVMRKALETKYDKDKISETSFSLEDD